jgi:hypothetical protein
MHTRCLGNVKSGRPGSNKWRRQPCKPEVFKAAASLSSVEWFPFPLIEDISFDRFSGNIMFTIRGKRDLFRSRINPFSRHFRIRHHVMPA